MTIKQELRTLKSKFVREGLLPETAKVLARLFLYCHNKLTLTPEEIEE